MRKPSAEGRGALSVLVRGLTGIFLLFATGFAACPSPPPSPSASLDKEVVEARGNHFLTLTVNRWGRYSIYAKSGQGTAVELVDRMFGPMGVFGSAGKSDGRTDVFLDAGTYRVITRSSQNGTGKAHIFVKAFEDSNPDAIPVLTEFSSHSATLKDFQSVSYWLIIEKRRPVYLEAAGRALADMRLWLNGSWLTDFKPTITTITPETGRDMADCRMAVTLDPGRYLVVAYGGPQKPWTGNTTASPLFFRYGIPELDPVVRTPEKVSPFGEDLFLVNGPASHFYLYTDKKEPFRLGVSTYASGELPGSPYSSAAISKKSVEPTCKVVGDSNARGTYSLLSIKGAPGHSYEIQAMKPWNYYDIHGLPPGDYWLSTVHTGYIGDNIDASGILVGPNNWTHVVPESTSVPLLSWESGWARRFNLLSTATLFFEVKTAGNYTVTSSGVTCKVKFEPFMINKPPHYKSPPLKNTPHAFSLEKGFYVMTISPVKKGIVTMAVARNENVALSMLRSVLGGNRSKGLSPVKGWCQFPLLHLDDTRFNLYYTLYLNRQPGVDWDVVIRPYPLKLDKALPIGLLPGRQITVDFTAKRSSELILNKPKKGGLVIRVDGRVRGGSPLVDPGVHKLLVKNVGPDSILFSLRLVPHLPISALEPKTLPSILSAKMTFPLVTEKNPVFFDLPRGGLKTALLRVDKPGLYRIETTGLLKTGCRVRTRTRTKLFSDNAGGVGRNCLVQQYLKPGEYQVTVQALGESAGHAGLRIKRTAVIKGGELPLGRVVKDFVPADSAVMYTFKIPDDKTLYRVETLGLDKRFRCRIEDSEGWPIISPKALSNLTLRRSTGVYSYMSLPLPVATTRLTSFTKVPAETRISGRGPHDLRFNKPLGNIWRKGEGADSYLFSVTAPLEASISLGNTFMRAEVQKKSGGGYVKVADVWPRKTWRGPLSTGSYRLAVTCSRDADLVPYTVSLSTRCLAPGLSQRVSVPSTLKVSLAKESIVQLSSYGAVDTRAVLEKLPGHEVVAQNDDAYDDWNFLISRRLAAGQYLMKVEAAANRTGSTLVSMKALTEEQVPTLTLPVDKPFKIEDRIVALPLQLPETPGLLSVRAESTGSLGLIIEEGGARKRVLAQKTGHDCEIDIPVKGDSSLQIKLWSSDDQSSRARLKIDFKAVQATPIEEWRKATVPETVSFNGRGVSIARVSIPTAGTFVVKPTRGLLFSRGAEHPMEKGSSMVSLPAGTAWFMWTGMDGMPAFTATIKRYRLLTARKKPFTVRTEQGRMVRIDLPSSATGYLVLETSAMSDRPACSFAAPSAAPDFPAAVAIAEHSCVSVARRSGPLQAVVWEADPLNASPDLYNVSLKNFSQNTKGAALKVGLNTGVADGSQALELALPPGANTLDLSLDANLLAVFWKQDRPVRLLLNREGALYDRISTDAGRLTLFNLSNEQGSYSISMASGEAPPTNNLTLTAPFLKLCETFGTIRLKVDLGDSGFTDFKLRSSGTSKCEWIGSDGSVETGDDLPLTSSSGVVELSHSPGLVEAWLVKKGEESGNPRWGSAPTAAENLEAGREKTVTGSQHWFPVTLTRPSVLHLRSHGPSLTALADSEGGILQVSSGAASSFIDRYLPAGDYLAGVKSVGSGGVSFSYYLEEAIPITGKVGPDSLLGPGQTKTFSFKVEKKGSVGIALQADADLLDCRVSDDRGATVGEGVQQYLTLEPGTYLLSVSCAPGKDLPPVHFRPVVLGLNPPPDTPPQEYLENFLKSIGVRRRTGQ